jgi:hypothetical protein
MKIKKEKREMKIKKIETNENDDAVINISDEQSSTEVIVHVNQNEVKVWSNRSINLENQEATNSITFKIDRRRRGNP